MVFSNVFFVLQSDSSMSALPSIVVGRQRTNSSAQALGSPRQAAPADSTSPRPSRGDSDTGLKNDLRSSDGASNLTIQTLQRISKVSLFEVFILLFFQPKQNK